MPTVWSWWSWYGDTEIPWYLWKLCFWTSSTYPAVHWSGSLSKTQPTMRWWYHFGIIKPRGNSAPRIQAILLCLKVSPKLQRFIIISYHFITRQCHSWVHILYIDIYRSYYCTTFRYTHNTSNVLPHRYATSMWKTSSGHVLGASRGAAKVFPVFPNGNAVFNN